MAIPTLWRREADPIEPVKVDRMLYKLKGSSGRAKAAFQELRNEHGSLREKLELYFQQLRQANPAETALRPIPGEVTLHARAGGPRN
ncbi:hypothetical protein V6N12_063388 [Hibiscus sabdariffa]|uniref:Uncharacterized protein n=1 Tax=Hibiscus sabdariffa TaxID=183260 RepID=A0ABR2FBM1_9ROSI